MESSTDLEGLLRIRPLQHRLLVYEDHAADAEGFQGNKTQFPCGSGLSFSRGFSGLKERDQDIHDEWDKKLDRMIFLLGEMDEGSCSKQNPYEDEYFETVRKLMEPPVEHPDGTSTHRYPDLKKNPEYRELDENYHAEKKAS